MAEPRPRTGEGAASGSTAYEVVGLRVEDAVALGEVHCRIWRETYADLMTPEALARLDPVRFGRVWTDRAEQLAREGELPGGERLLVARHDGSPVGFISTGEPRDEDPPVGWQLWALNVLPEHQGTGLAHRLLAEGLGDRAAYLWVAQGNERAIRFYRGHGFAEDGVEHTDRADGMTELRMVR
jgi:ribosomal protein S18 acetylase RimI-like enzyme